jgi:alanyl-tRNA synthetase
VILAETPLYAESGGQVSDQGVLEGPGFRAVVSDVQKPVPGLISHTVTIAEGEIGVGDTVKAVVDPLTRYEGARAHSATHLIHAALRDTLGSHATQAGSLNRPGYMRLDFSWNQALSDDALSAISEITNNAIRDDLEVSTKIMPVAEAKAAGAMALFGEKYGDVVRMVDIGGPWSRELCAGTHVGRSSQIGVVTLLGESSVSSTARRIEALVGSAAVADFSVEKSIVRRITQLLKTPREELPGRIEDLLGQVKNLERQVAKTAQAATGALAPALVKGAIDIAGVSVVAQVISESLGADDIRVLATTVLSGLGESPAAVVLGSVSEGRGTVVVAANPAGTGAGVHAGNLVKTASTIMGGGGGGKPGLAQGGGPEGASLQTALDAVVAELGQS